MMVKTQLTIGLFDKDTESQKINTSDAKNIIAKILINNYNIFAFTMIECSGVYKMASTGSIVFEPSIRVEIATDNDLSNIYPNENIQDSSGKKLNTLDAIISELKYILNQESIMLEISSEKIYFK